MFEEDVPSVLELEMEDFDQWITKDCKFSYLCYTNVSEGLIKLKHGCYSFMVRNKDIYRKLKGSEIQTGHI